ncbi:hypothetical protein [Actinomadura sp. 9N407]|uniref:hypothetical protein n=1 Tax=Actinomadura sp. 9N407 TaxID=3375154 RepID=UPI00379D25ED
MRSAAESKIQDQASADMVNRLLVAWQHPQSRSISPVGRLEQQGNRYSFRYLQRASEVEGFKPFIGFPDLASSYDSTRLFPLFRQRVMDPKRPDYVRYLETLGLGEDAAPMEILSRSAGIRQGDAIMLFPEPPVQADGSTKYSFLVHGVRHMAKFGAEERIADLKSGDELTLIDEPSNPVNPRALLVTSSGEYSLGWVPDLLLEYVHRVRDEGGSRILVERTNGPDVPWHLRLCVCLVGKAPTGWKPFEGPGWKVSTR